MIMYSVAISAHEKVKQPDMVLVLLEVRQQRHGARHVHVQRSEHCIGEGEAA